MPIDGKWTGHYVQSNYKDRRKSESLKEDTIFPIEAEFQSADGVVTGAMKDLRTVQEALIAEVIRPTLHKLGFLEQFQWKKTLLMYPKATITTTLPVESTLKGSIDGDQVSFTKRYSGQATVVCTYGSTSQTSWNRCAEITYKGRLDSTGTVIRGRYEFPPEVDQPSDEFELRRVPG